MAEILSREIPAIVNSCIAMGTMPIGLDVTCRECLEPDAPKFKGERDGKESYGG